MAEAPLMLGVSGLRGMVGSTMTPDVASRYAAAFGTWLGGRSSPAGKPARGARAAHRVVVGRDGRHGGDIFLDAACAGLRSVGCDVINVGIASTPTIGVMVDHLGADAGLVITASHNPQVWNGIKPIVRDTGLKAGQPSAGAPDKKSADELVSRFQAQRIDWRGHDGLGQASATADAAEIHIKSVLAHTGQADVKRIKAEGFKVTLDTVAGAGIYCGRQMLEALGCKVIELYPPAKHDDGIFPHAPEPISEHLLELRRGVRRDHSAIGFAQDPDADRLAIVDEKGQYIGEEYTLALAALSLLELRAMHPVADGKSNGKPASKSNGKSNGKVGSHAHSAPVLVANLSTSRMLDDVALRYGARVIRTPVGEANVAEVMKRCTAEGHDVVIGGEGNGGVIWPRVTYIRDSLSSMALVLSLIARSGKTVSELVAGLPAYNIVKRKVTLTKRDGVQPVLEKLARVYVDQRLDRQDGLRIDVESKKAWMHVRPSNTEPIMRLIAEAPTRQVAETLLDQAARVIGV